MFQMTPNPDPRWRHTVTVDGAEQHCRIIGWIFENYEAESLANAFVIPVVAYPNGVADIAENGRTWHLDDCGTVEVDR